MSNIKINKKGIELIQILVFTSIFLMLGAIMVNVLLTQNKAVNIKINREKIFQMAEAGINYAKWRVAHDPENFNSEERLYKDINGNDIGKYKLTFTPPASGSTIFEVRSSAYFLNDPSIKRTIKVTIGLPSFTKYSVAANDNMRFGDGTEINGPVHSNEGIRFDCALAHDLVTSSKETYNDPDHSGDNEFGIHTHCSPTDPLPPSAVPERLDVFAGGREFPVPNIDFDGVTSDLTNLKTKADNNGIYLPPSSGYGYYIHFNPDDTVDIYEVDSLIECQRRVCFIFCWWVNYDQEYSIDTQSSFTYKSQSSIGLEMPANGIILAEDNIWIDGQIDGQRVSVVAAEEPMASGTANIIVNNDLTYTNYDGSDVIGLIAQNDIAIGMISENNLTLDGALIAQNGFVGRYHYNSSSNTNPAYCSDYINRDIITLNGSIATNRRYGFAYTDGTGYDTRNLNFDEQLILSPPPSFPTTGDYDILTWEEL